MKKTIAIFAVMLTVLAVPQVAKAYDFSYTYQGSTLHYNIVDGAARVVSYDVVASALVIPDSVEFDGVRYAVTSIGLDALRSCRRLTSVVIPDGVTAIGEWAFAECGLDSLIVGTGLTYVYPNAFKYDSISFLSFNCRANAILAGIDYRNSVSTIFVGDSGSNFFGSIFATYPNLTTIDVADGNTKYDSRDSCNAVIETATNELVAGCRTTVIPISVTSIGKYSFVNCAGLTSIVIPDGVTSIGEWAFGGCDNLTSVSLPDGITSIGQGIFSSKRLTSVTVGSNTLTVASSDTTKGLAYIRLCDATWGLRLCAVAEPKRNHHFVAWSDSSTSLYDTILLTGNVDLTAYFEDVDVGIGDVATKDIRVYSCDGEIVLEGTRGEAVSVYDMMGRRIFGMAAAPEPCRVAVPQRGVYLVKAGNLPARKIVVVR